MTASFRTSLYDAGWLAYVREVWRYRFFVGHLARADVRSRFRRSYLGFLWAGLQPLLLASMFSYVLATFSNAPFQEYAIFVFSGFVLWEIITGSCIGGSVSLIGSASYLHQHRIPIAVFGIRAVLQQLMISCAGLFAFALFTFVIYPGAISWSWLMLPFVFALLIVFCVPLAIACSILNALFRDFQPVLTLFIQGMWFVSPIFIARHVFDTDGLKAWTAINPIASLCDIWRDVLVHASIPSFEPIALVLAYSILFWVVAIFLLRRFERRITFYL